MAEVTTQAASANNDQIMAKPINRIAQYFVPTGHGTELVLGDLLGDGSCDAGLDDAVADELLLEFTDVAMEFTETCDGATDSTSDALNSDSPAIVRLLDLLLVELRLLGARKILIAPVHDVAPVWFEVDGELIERDRLSLDAVWALATRLEAGVVKTPALDSVDVRIVATNSGPEIVLTPAELRHITPGRRGT